MHPRKGQGVFTQEQANAGHSAYTLSCAGCHRANLAGGGDAPGLSGNGFMTSFGGKSTKDLYNFIATSMPAGAPGSLSEDQYTNITAYLLWANGAKPGTDDLQQDHRCEGLFHCRRQGGRRCDQGRAHGQDGRDGSGWPRSLRRRSAMAWMSPARSRTMSMSPTRCSSIPPTANG